ncbi:hypothetical protein E2C01_026771 [Portunus trituberculatus]|uniref:Uncharacterized protein n=1 Tax=Portunus trituberculatus TaxID=210409 RepID=A0A5B7EH01_PORTR|nr:hypothetical protein [Portunus trituberculatus]
MLRSLAIILHHYRVIIIPIIIHITNDITYATATTPTTTTKHRQAPHMISGPYPFIPALSPALLIRKRRDRKMKQEVFIKLLLLLSLSLLLLQNSSQVNYL